MMYVMALGKKLICYDYIRSYKKISQKYISKCFFFPFLKMCFVALGTDYIIA